MTVGRTAGAAMLALVVCAAPLSARDTLGVWRGWAAFRDPDRCYAIAQPHGRPREGRRPFASVATWPTRGLRAALHVHLSRLPRDGQPVTLTIAERRFRLAVRGQDAFAADVAGDRGIAAALRAGRSMSVEAVAADGQPFSDTYTLAGAATAIDAATLACSALR